jgi:hypothetical protein
MRMLQVLLYPCVVVHDAEWAGGTYQQHSGTNDVQVVCRCLSRSQEKSAFAQLKPELGSALNEAAQRAFDSVSMGAPWD